MAPHAESAAPSPDYKGTARRAARGIAQLFQGRPAGKDEFRALFRAYVLAKFALDEAEAPSDNFEQLAEASLAKALAADPDLVRREGQSPTCDGASSTDMKQALFLMAAQRELNVRVDTMKAAFAVGVDDVADVFWEALDGGAGTGGCAGGGAESSARAHTSASGARVVAGEVSVGGDAQQAKAAARAPAPGGDEQARAVRACFPLLKREVNGHPLVYLDNAATMPMPQAVIDALYNLRTQSYANVHRGAHTLSQISTEAFDRARETVAAFLGASRDEVMFTAGATDSLNRTACMLESRLSPESVIVATVMEHHSNLLPWQQLARRAGCALQVVGVDENGALDMTALEQAIDVRTAVVAVTQLSNVTGLVNDCAAIARIVRARAPHAALVVDGAQGVAHTCATVESLRCDLYAFSGHKIGAPTGIGVLWVREALLAELQPTAFGGGAVESVAATGFTFNGSISRFEPGTPHIDGAIGLAAAVAFWQQFNREALFRREEALLAQLENGLRGIEGAHILGNAQGAPRKSCLSFVPASGSTYKWARALDQLGIAARSGKHCAEPYHNALGAAASVRLSVAPFTTSRDIEAALAALHEIASATPRQPPL